VVHPCTDPAMKEAAIQIQNNLKKTEISEEGTIFV
jgi:hypothetical protein